MASISDLKNIPYSGQYYIDALLDDGPHWNYLTGNPANTIYYSFASENPIAPNMTVFRGTPAQFDAAQQAATRSAMDYLGDVTGIRFVETAAGLDAQVHFLNMDITDPVYAGWCTWNYRYTNAEDGDTLTRYMAQSTIYLDQDDAQAMDVTPGTQGYQILLHELGHMLGLKHPFDDDPVLPAAEDLTSNTVMSYDWHGGPYTTYRPYDVAALFWLYGSDGLGGRYGVDAQGRYLVGTSGADVLTATDGDDLLFGAKGNDTLDGGAGIDRLMSNAAVDMVHIERTATGFTVTGPDGVDTLVNIERAQFGSQMVALDIDGNGGSAYRLYRAAFDRAPDAVGLGYWIGVLDGGVSLRDVAAGFIASDEFVRLYQGKPDDATFVDSMYRNILHRAPEQGGYDFWVGALAGGGDRADVLSAFSESFENKDALAAVIGNGFEYTPYYG